MSDYIPQKGDYGVVKTNGIIARLIQLFTVSRWNHAFIYAGNSLIIEANPKGVEFSPLSKYPKIAWNRHEDITPSQRDFIVSYARIQFGKPYNFILIGNILLRVVGLKMLARTRLMMKLAQTNSYICSELVAESYHKAGVELSPKACDLVTPGELAERLIYQ